MTSTISNDQIKAVRAQFPALVAVDAGQGPASGYVYAENAGGSQVLSSVAESISSYLLNTNVQMANYNLAKRAESKVSLGSCAAAALLGADSVEDVMIGQSATSLVAAIAAMIENKVLEDRKNGKAGDAWKEGDEIVISDADHETNRGAWTRMAERLGLVVKHWPVTVTATADASKNPFAVTLDPKVLSDLLTPKTRLVAFTACSNLLGAFTPISEAVSTIRSVAPAALVAVDCVAFAPHRRVTPSKWGVDIAFFSMYKIYGAHVGAMYVNPGIKQRALKRLNHFFLQPPSSSIPGMYPYQTSSVQYELNHSIAAVADYLVSLGQGTVGSGNKVDWNGVYSAPTWAGSEAEELVKMTKKEVDSALDGAFSKIAIHESTLMSALIPTLLKYHNKGVRIVGPEEYDSTTRAPTVAFAITTTTTTTTTTGDDKHRVGTSKLIHSKLVESGQMGAQQGHMYAHKLVSSLGLDLNDGVVRLSFVHYNTVEEVKRVVQLLETVFDEVL
ncbi:uncharacterized protein UTRI_01111_B [Ustilago trichophora]|uniref:Aminotransferase class V domain-containing protein n=1 Tax=Ustilago trichophora TaxID=86804 RepID=A0A5C3DW98_9BASI|nr:uncharacterized protein UTRI_01111_B [Ustilago trichophora]